MKSLKILENADNSLTNILYQITYSNTFVSNEIAQKVKSLTVAIKKDLKVDYSTGRKFKPNEKERLVNIYVAYLTGKSDNFNSHYIQLLAWHLLDLKIMPSKDRSTKVSIFEYAPNPFAIYTVIEKTFRLFNKKRIDSNKVSYALISTYLNNYNTASNRYKNELRKYLKGIRFCEDLDVYFNINNIISYTINKTSKTTAPEAPFPERLTKLRIHTKTLNTKYFADAWFAWMFKAADLLDESYVLKNFNCHYFENCNEDMQKIIMAKIIHDNNLNYMRNRKTDMICINYLFPAIKKGNPFKKEFWELNYTGIYKEYLDYAWFFIEEAFIKNKSHKNMIHFED